MHKQFISILASIWMLLANSMSSYGQQQPNIIFILADDLGYQSLGAYGQQIIKTPNLDRLAKAGMQFTNFYSNAICSPSRGSLMTGMDNGHGLIRDNQELGGFEDSTEFGQMPLQANMATLGKVMQEAGYYTAVIGKWGLGGPGSPGVPDKQGIDFFYGYLDQKQAHNYYPSHLWRNDRKENFDGYVSSAHQKLPQGANPHEPASYTAYSGQVYACDTMTTEAIKFIKGEHQKPFLLMMTYTLPHMALQVPERALKPYLGKFEEKPYLGGYLPNRTPRATYAAMITLLDSYVGELVKALESRGLDKNTLVVFASDNGAATSGGCDPDYFQCTGSLRGRKGSVYEGGIKSPLIAYWPNTIPPGGTSAHLTALWDLLPTFAELGQKPVDFAINGISFAPTLLGQQEKQQEHPFLYWETHGRGGAQAVRFGSWKAVKTGVHQPDKTPHLALYQLTQDPSEQRDIAAEHPDVIKQAEAYLQTRELAVLPEWNYYLPKND